jgi:hypothetical protein
MIKFHRYSHHELPHCYKSPLKHRKTCWPLKYKPNLNLPQSKTPPKLHGYPSFYSFNCIEILQGIVLMTKDQKVVKHTLVNAEFHLKGFGIVLSFPPKKSLEKESALILKEVSMKK